ncbi:hypothetical protein CMI42_02870 [Candidatus Pacearchaeota archaeon]|nr:hypothetical protein [Candidatus Pacearchaeota archaeon]|tara:strand:- start:780 stop:1349 length:570 start_codon:yes stop_codon:yes gene_type:complete
MLPNEKKRLERESRRGSIVDRLSRQSQISIPTIHYQIGDRDPRYLIDRLGIIMIEGSLIPEPDNGALDRFYSVRERIRSIEGHPITTVNVFLNRRPSYRIVREDGTNEFRSLICKADKVISVDLRVDNPLPIDKCPLDILVGIVPSYTKVRKGMFEIMDEFPLVEDQEYKDFVDIYADTDCWLINNPAP